MKPHNVPKSGTLQQISYCADCGAAYNDTNSCPGKRSGYVPCACRDCMETAIADRSKPLAYCHECEAAGCPDYQGQPGMSQECRAPSAYGGDES
jgi:hypothetical protein